MPDPCLSHIALTCDDPIAVERYYTKHFGFRRARVVDMGQGAQIVFLRGAGTVLELFRADEPKPVAQATGDGYHWSGVRNVSFEVDDVDRKIEEMGSDAVVTFGPLGFDDIVPGWRSAWLRDPTGNIIQITKGYTDQENPPTLPPQ
ncbi:MAG: VOC family protein [Mycobacterium sp.]|nr:VOC family protein [Mycobacterium sp.]